MTVCVMDAGSDLWHAEIALYETGLCLVAGCYSELYIRTNIIVCQNNWDAQLFGPVGKNRMLKNGFVK